PESRDCVPHASRRISCSSLPKASEVHWARTHRQHSSNNGKDVGTMATVERMLRHALQRVKRRESRLLQGPTSLAMNLEQEASRQPTADRPDQLQRELVRFSR